MSLIAHKQCAVFSLDKCHGCHKYQQYSWMFDTTIANVNSIDGCLIGYSHTCDSPGLLTFTQLTMETRLPVEIHL